MSLSLRLSVACFATKHCCGVLAAVRRVGTKSRNFHQFAIKMKPHKNSEEAIRLNRGALGGFPLSPVKTETTLDLPVKTLHGRRGGAGRWYPQKVIVPGPGASRMASPTATRRKMRSPNKSAARNNQSTRKMRRMPCRKPLTRYLYTTEFCAAPAS